MTELLESGWWRCNCLLDCNCSDYQPTVNRLNPPELSKCPVCQEYNPAKVQFLSPEEQERLVQRDALRASVKDKSG